MTLSHGSRYRLGLIGAGIQASRTPAMHEREAAAQGLQCEYRLIDLAKPGVGVEALPGLIDEAERQGFAGLNITHPCKQAVLPLLHELSDDARAIGAVNTVVFSNGRRVGHNTDWFGFAESFRRHLPDVGIGNVVQLGAGGGGAAVSHALLTLGVQEILLFDIDNERASGLAAALCARFGEGRASAGTDLESSMRAADGLVHATPTGMTAHPGLPLPAELLRSSLWVAEIVYFPLETALLRAARDLKCRTMNGSAMAVFQAVEAFRLFTGIAPDAKRMQRHFESMVRK
ncbi:MAG TPA: shikimate dehydrogenase [Burkholderiales bacterium]|nr:shikimate dehydrogenase [Burkholderiales bacterium]